MKKPNLPNQNIYFTLLEKTGDRTDSLVIQVRDLSEGHNLRNQVSLAGISPATTGDTLLTYRVEVGDDKALTFLEQVFKKFYNKMPAYVERPSL